MSKSLFRAALVVCLPLVGSAPTMAAAALSTPEFVKKTTISDMFEVESGKLAANQSENAEVKSFGQTMVTDHTKTSNELKDLLKQRDIKAEIPAKLDDEHQTKLDSLKNLSGAEFDRSYVPEQVKAHQQAVKMFEEYGSGGDNEQLKQWAQKTLPALQKHLEHAQTLKEELGKARTMVENAGSDKRENIDRKAEAEIDKTADAGSNINYVVQQRPTDWSAQALLGRTVYNPAGETLGEINNIILNEQGDVVAVTIGVGGFLGIGEKDVGVPFKALQFKTEAAVARQATNEDSDGKTEDRRAQSRNQDAKEAREARYDSEHVNIQVVLNATREQLEKAPNFVWLDEQVGNRG